MQFRYATLQHWLCALGGYPLITPYTHTLRYATSVCKLPLSVIAFTITESGSDKLTTALHNGAGTMTNITIRMSNELKALLKLKAKSANKSISMYIRELITTSEVKLNNKDYVLLAEAVNRIGNNINQIARNLNIANKQGALSEQDYDELLNVLLLIWSNTKALLDEERKNDNTSDES